MQFPTLMHYAMLVNVKLDISGYKRITLQGCIFSLVLLISNGTDETKLAILAFLHCGEFVKNSPPQLVDIRGML